MKELVKSLEKINQGIGDELMYIEIIVAISVKNKKTVDILLIDAIKLHWKKNENPLTKISFNPPSLKPLPKPDVPRVPRVPHEHPQPLIPQLTPSVPESIQKEELHECPCCETAFQEGKLITKELFV